MGKYEVLEELGSGAMGVVYKARDPIINRLVALKKIKANVADSPALLERFYREAQSAGSLQHPNIVTIYEMGEEAGVPFIAMQLIDGQNLGNLIAQRATIPLSLKLVYAVEACRAFAYAHKQGIIHRDIKPGNIMVSKEGAVKVVDFGIARVLENSKTQTGMLIGTFAYMPPEVFNGEHADERSDIFSFGVLLYELFAYTRPFPGDIPASLMQAICMKEPIPLLEAAPDCPPELAAVVHRTLVKSVTERTQSMEDLLLELDPICKGLQAQTSADLVAGARALVHDREFAQARELLLQALQVDFTNRPARTLMEEVNAELKRILIRPRVESHVNAGRAFLEEGRIQEAQLEAESALKLDSSFEPAGDLLQQIQKEIGRAKLISEWLQTARERLAEGLPEESEGFLAKIQEIDPANRHAGKLQQQVLEEKAARQRRLHLLETMQQARTLWMQQKYDDCIDLLTSLQKEFGKEEDVQKLLDTARDDRAEQHKRQTLERARALLATGNYGECKPLLAALSGEFPGDEEILNVLEQVRKDEAEQRKQEALNEARNLLTARCYEDCLDLLGSLKAEFPDESEIGKLVEAVRADQEAERKEQGLKEARSLLGSQRYDQCQVLLAGLQGEFPADPEIVKLLDTLREEKAEQRRLQGLSEARKLLASKQYAECLALLGELNKRFPEDKEIPALVEEVQKDRVEQQRLQGLSDARKLHASRQYADSLTLLKELKTKFPNDQEVAALAEEVRKDQTEQQRLAGLSQAQKLFASKLYSESLGLLTELKAKFPEDKEIPALAETVRKEKAEQERQDGLSQARTLLASRQFAKSLTLLSELKKQYPQDREIPALVESVLNAELEQQKLEGLSQAQKLFASRQYAESIALLGELKKQFPDEKRISMLAETVRKDQAEQQKLEGLSRAQKLLASKQYAESLALLGELKKQSPEDRQISALAEAVRKDQAEQQKLQGLADARNLRAARQYAEALTLLGELKAKFPDDKLIPSLAEAIQKDQAEQRRLDGLSEARKFLTSKEYVESIARLSRLKTEFPDDKEILKLAEAVRREQAEQQKQQDLAKARMLRVSKQYAESLTLLNQLKALFPDDREIPRLAEAIQKDQAEQRKLQGLSEARNLFTSKRLEESFALLTGLRKEFPREEDIARLLATVEQARAEEQKQKRLTEARSLLGSQRFGEALAVLDLLLAANAKDASVLKLRALILEEQEKVAKAARLGQELQVLKRLISDESYETAIAKAESLLREFPNDLDLTRLLGFARTRKEQNERERRLNQIIEEVKKFIASNKLPEAIASARRGLDSFAGNSDLMRLLDDAEGQRKKELTRTQIRQQVQQIKTKIHREEFSDAVRLAQDAISTLGPDSDLTQLLNSAMVETQSRDKKREQGRMFEKVRALLEKGDWEGATLLLDNTINDHELDTTDPRVERLSKEIAEAAKAKDGSIVPGAPANPTKEYAFLEGPPPIAPLEQDSSTEQNAAQASSVAQTGSAIPQFEIKAQPQMAPEPAATEAKIAPVTTPYKPSSASRVAANQPLVVPAWKRPPTFVAGALGIVLAASAVGYFLHRSSSPQGSTQTIGKQGESKALAVPPAKILPESQQRDLINAADKAIGQGDFNGAKAALDQAKNINGALNPEIDRKLSDVEKAIDNAATASVLRQEETLWSEANTYTQNGQFAEAQKALREILKLPSDGGRKTEARQYLTEVIPRRQREEQLFAQAQQSMNGKDSRSYQQAADLFGEAAKLNGPKQQAALKNQQEALANLTRSTTMAALTDGARQDLKRGDFRSSHQKAQQLQQAGGDSASLALEIDKAEQVRFSQLDASLNQLKQRADEGAVQSLKDLQPQFQALVDGGGPTTNDARRDAAGIPDAVAGVQARVTYQGEESGYQQALQRYRSIANEKVPLDSSRSDFQSIAKGGGHRAADAQKIVDEINGRVASLSPAVAPSGAGKSNPIVDETPAVLAAVQRYADAFDRRDADDLRQVWPTMTAQDYGKFKNSFGEASGIQIQIANEKVELAADGATAAVNADITRSYTPKEKGQKTLTSKDHTVFHLFKSNGAWAIRDLK